MPAVSVIVAAYRAHAYLGEALDSVLAQSFSDFEIIIAPDEPADYAAFAARDPRIVLLPGVPAPTGPGPARNRALDRARGGYVALLDCDDLISPNYLELLAPEAERHGAAFGRTAIEQAGRELRSAPAWGYSGPAGFAIFEQAFASFHGVVRKTPGRHWREAMAEDVLFDLESLALAGGRAPYVAEAVYRLRLRADSVTKSGAFQRNIDAAYGDLIASIESGATDIPAAFVKDARGVFDSWRRMNARFREAQENEPGLLYQDFVANWLERQTS